MNAESDIFRFIQQFKEICAITYQTEVEVKILHTVPVIKVSPEQLISFVETLMMNDPDVPKRVKYTGLGSNARYRELVLYRQCTTLILRNQGMSLSDIGKLFGKNHSTILQGIRGLKGLLDTNDAETVRIFNRIKHELKETFNIDADTSDNTRTRLDT